MALPVHNNITILPPEPRRPGLQRPSDGPGESFADVVRRETGNGNRRGGVDQDAEDRRSAPRVEKVIDEEAVNVEFSAQVEAAGTRELAAGYGSSGSALSAQLIAQGGGRGEVLDLLV